MGSSLFLSSPSPFLPASHLEHLEIRFPREPLQTSLLLPVLKASKLLHSLSLDSVAITHPEEVGFLLQALKGTMEAVLPVAQLGR